MSTPAPNRKWWTWNGRRLAPLHTIVRRLAFAPLIELARCALWAAVAGGWGLDEATDMWRRTQ